MIEPETEKPELEIEPVVEVSVPKRDEGCDGELCVRVGVHVCFLQLLKILVMRDDQREFLMTEIVFLYFFSRLSSFLDAHCFGIDAYNTEWLRLAKYSMIIEIVIFCLCISLSKISKLFFFFFEKKNRKCFEEI